MERLIAGIRSVPLARGFEEVLYPGELEARAEERNRREGLLLPQRTLSDLEALAAETGVERALARPGASSPELRRRSVFALVVELHVRPGIRSRFLEAVEENSPASVRDEPGCLRFEVVQDDADLDHFFFFYRYTWTRRPSRPIGSRRTSRAGATPPRAAAGGGRTAQPGVHDRLPRRGP
jgi:Antibiotic biosynthesis monooxygenase